MRRKLALVAVFAMVLAVFPLGLGAGAVSASIEIFDDASAFADVTGATPIAWETDANTALPTKPWSQYSDYSCSSSAVTTPAGQVTISRPTGGLLCYLGAGWDAGTGNTNPTPVAPTIVGNGEDDYTVTVNLTTAQHAVGIGLLTNKDATETLKVTFSDGTTEIIPDADLGTATNSFEFIGLRSLKPIKSIEIDTTGGASQNEGITGIWLSPWHLAPTTSCPPGQIYVSSVGSGAVTPIASVPVNEGFSYNVTASGTFFAGGRYDYDIQADAEYSQDAAQRASLAGWTDLVNGYEGYGEGLLELTIDGQYVEWGAFSDAHSYTIPRTATSGQMDFAFQIYDIFAQNNYGGLCVSLDQIPFAIITAPSAGDVIFTSLELAADYYDDNPAGVSWAVRKKTNASCAYDGTNATVDNVGEGDQVGYAWVDEAYGKSFYAGPFDVTAWDPGAYCFVLNPAEGPGEGNVREIVDFYVGRLGDLSPAMDYNPVGTMHTVTTNIGAMVAGVEVTFDISGANAQIGSAMTDAEGNASFSWLGELPGTDIVTACIDPDGDGCDGDDDLSTAANTATKYWLEHYVTGGGQLVEGKGNAKESISFGGTFGYDLAGNVVGNWQVNFHDVGIDALDKGNFHTTAFTSAIRFYDFGAEPAPPEALYDFAAVNAVGRFNGEDGWRILIRVVDDGEPGTSDSTRLELWSPDGTLHYDTQDDFGAERNNQSWLDKGNLQIHPPDLP